MKMERKRKKMELLYHLVTIPKLKSKPTQVLTKIPSNLLMKKLLVN